MYAVFFLHGQVFGMGCRYCGIGHLAWFQAVNVYEKMLPAC